MQSASSELGTRHIKAVPSLPLFSTTLRPPAVARNLDKPPSSCSLVSYIHIVKLPDAGVC